MTSKTLSEPHPKYRPEIDGLRTLAVIPVILFHAGFKRFSGGFVGVDIFFVISGYLITTIILAELEAGKFSIINFYERRARRILPALFLVMAVCMPFAWLWLLPSDMEDFSQSVAAVSAFASNILFWRESGYFETTAELKPLLHTWSLAVEEQFYVLFPLFLMLTWRLGKKCIVTTLAVVAVASLIAAHWGAFNKPPFTFFMLPTRGWELMIGSFIAFHFSSQHRFVQNNKINQSLSAVGLLLIIYSIFAFSERTPFPSLYALLPTIGAALIILFAIPNTLVGALLSSKAFVGIGLISYSAYLWHQPLFAFARHRSLHEPNLLVFAMLSVVALVLAYFSWRFVEQPFRRKTVINRTAVFTFALVGSTAFFALGLMGHFTNGYFFQESQKEKFSGLEYRVHDNPGLSSTCAVDFNTSSDCSTDDEPEVILWGDSFAMHLVQGLQVSNPQLKLIQKTVSMCGPVLGIAPTNHKYTEEWAKKCIGINDKVFEYIKQSKTLKYAVLSSPFRQYVDEDWKILLRSGEVVSGKNYLLQYFLNTLRELVKLDITPVIVSPTPMNGQNFGRCLVKATKFNEDIHICDFRLSDAKERHRNVFELLKRIEHEFKVIWLTDAICEKDICRASIDNTFIYRDDGHLSQEGSAFLGGMLKIDELISRKPLGKR